MATMKLLILKDKNIGAGVGSRLTMLDTTGIVNRFDNLKHMLH